MGIHLEPGTFTAGPRPNEKSDVGLTQTTNPVQEKTL
jgi:hypothetical protein